MRSRSRCCAVAFGVLIQLAWGAAPASAGEQNRAEIDALLVFVGSSGCDFIRNGIRHRPEEARDHLAMKLSRAGGRVETAEDFIRYVATRSSITGRPYGVSCPDAEIIESHVWLLTELERLRAARPSGLEPGTGADGL